MAFPRRLDFAFRNTRNVLLREWQCALIRLTVRPDTVEP
jgi:hypothetical protein